MVSSTYVAVQLNVTQAVEPSLDRVRRPGAHMRELDKLQTLVTFRRIDMRAVSASLDELPLDAGVEVAVVIAQARRSLTEMSFGKYWYRARLQHAIKRLVDLFEKGSLGASIGGANVRFGIVGDIE